MLEGGHCDRNKQHWIRLIKSVVLGGNAYVSFNMKYHKGMNFTKKKKKKETNKTFVF